MLRVALASLRRYKARYVTTVLAVVLGVVFVTGTLVFSDMLEGSYESRVMGSAGALSTVVHSAEDGVRDYEPVDTEVLEDIRDLPEVDEASGMVSGRAPVLDDQGRALGITATAAVAVGELSRFEATDGAMPDSDDEAAISDSVAENLSVGIGDTISVAGPDDTVHEFTVTGIVDFGVEQIYSSAGAAVYTEDTARMLSGIAEGYNEIAVRGADGTTDAEVTEAVEEVAGSGDLVRTGEEFGTALAEAAGTEAQLLRTALLLFGVVAMFVAGIVIYNTFAILIAQRQRDLALLRCLGSHRGQVFRSVIVEAVAVGLVASALGTALGAGTGYAAMRLAGPVFDVATADMRFSLPLVAVVAGLSLGTVMTVIASALPAVRATRVAPLAALRSSATATGIGRGLGWLRWCAGVVFLAGSAGLVALAMRSAPSEAALLMVVGAGLVAFFGVAVLGPAIVRAAVGLVGVVLRRLGVAGQLAVDNSRRSPRRAATAMIALIVGATLITGYSVISASLEETTTAQLDAQFPVDYAISAQIGGGEDGAEEGVPPEIAATLAEVPEVGAVFAQRTVYPEQGGADSPPATTYFEARLGEDIEADTVEGELSDLEPGGVVLSQGFAQGVGVGDDYTLTTDDGREETFEVAAIVNNGQTVYGAVLDPVDFVRVFPDATADTMVFIQRADGVEEADLRSAIYEAVEDHPRLQVASTTEMRGEFEQMLQIALYTVAGMLGLAIVIALIGIANTLTLSVIERTRESALLRAMGLARRSLRRMLGIEAVVLSMIGTVIGVGLGIAFGWAAGASVLSALRFEIPVGQVAIFLAAGVAAGLLASIMPGRRAAQASITGALGAE